MPRQLILAVLEKKSYIVEGFLRIQVGRELLGWVTPDFYANQMKKFDLLLKWGTKDLLRKTIEENERLASDRVKTLLETAIKKHDDENKLLTDSKKH